MKKRGKRRPGQQWEDYGMADVFRAREKAEGEFINALAVQCFGPDWRERFYGEKVK